jgi:UDP-N-acetylglucosamine 2-epimerase (non-hydrolysing)
LPLLDRLVTIPPIPYEPFLGLLAECALCVSDSGGVQEEVSLLGRPVVVVRRSTERPEVQEVWATLVRPGPALGAAVRSLLDDLASLHARLECTPSPYGDGSASARTVEALWRLVG